MLVNVWLSQTALLTTSQPPMWLTLAPGYATLHVSTLRIQISLVGAGSDPGGNNPTVSHDG